ncbi:hypothetical protein COL922a_003719 [Colletotrichum nupharicola]|nr:hypothetical protein COL922a_003719 [Colletotrichum nupharicola]
MAQPLSLAQSVEKYDRYPMCLLAGSNQGTTVLKQHHDRIHESQRLLFLPDKEQFKVPIRDITAAGTVRKINIKNEVKLRGFLGDAPLQTLQAGQSPPNPPTIRPDPACRFIKYQLCFNLKTVALKENKQWKVRQAAIHHQFDLGQGTQLWMIADPHAAIKTRIGELYNEHTTYDTSFASMEQGFKSSLDVHLALARWATSEWRWHVRYLEEKAEQPELTIALKEKRHIESLDPGTLSEMQRWEEKANENIMVMESNVKVMELLQRFYRELVHDEDFPENQRRPCLQAVKNFAFQLDELICDTRMQVNRARVLVKILADRKAVVHFFHG